MHAAMGHQANAVLQSYPGRYLQTRWSISRTTTYAPGCVGPCTPGALVIPNDGGGLQPRPDAARIGLHGRLTQLDLGFRKIFRVRTYQFSGQVDIFNTTNSSYVKNQNTTLGASFGQPLETLQPRTLRLAVQMRF
jgi:hypothetical protein